MAILNIYLLFAKKNVENIKEEMLELHFVSKAWSDDTKCNFYPAHCTVAWHAISGLSSLLLLSTIQMILKPNRSAKLPGPRALTSQLGSVLVSIMVPVMRSIMSWVWCWYYWGRPWVCSKVGRGVSQKVCDGVNHWIGHGASHKVSHVVKCLEGLKSQNSFFVSKF